MRAKYTSLFIFIGVVSGLLTMRTGDKVLVVFLIVNAILNLIIGVQGILKTMTVQFDPMLGLIELQKEWFVTATQVRKEVARQTPDPLKTHG